MWIKHLFIAFVIALPFVLISCNLFYLFIIFTNNLKPVKQLIFAMFLHGVKASLLMAAIAALVIVATSKK